jgi:3-methyl-2-oxobutanoate hydroxymethyltransferase
MEKVTIPELKKMKREGRKITMVTAYDYPTAILADQAGVDIILVGDSVGMVMLGYSSTLPVTMSEMIHHAKAVVRGVKRAIVIGDMPFMSYNASIKEAVRNAGKFLKVGCDAVKVEGGAEIAETIRAIVDAGIPVMGHIGLTPQRFALLGGYKLQGRDAASARKIIEDAKALEKAGAFSVLLELTTVEVAKIITEELTIPTIGIGAGPYCDGQVLVVTDILGLTMWTPTPKFAKQYVNLSQIILNALKNYVNDVRELKFPTEEHSYHMEKEEFEKLVSSGVR